MSEERTKARRRGGRHSSKVSRAKRVAHPQLRALLDELEVAIVQVHDGSLTASRGSAMATLARAIVAVVEFAELEQRLAAIEEQLT